MYHDKSLYKPAASFDKSHAEIKTNQETPSPVVTGSVAEKALPPDSLHNVLIVWRQSKPLAQIPREPVSSSETED